MAKIHCHSLLSGSSWSSFDEESSEEEPEAMEVDENNTFGPSEATRLRYEDMNLYGLCPAQEEVCLVICKECSKVVKLSTFSRHCALLHKKVIPPPTPSPELVDDSTPVELLLESETKTSSPNQASIKIEKLEIEDSSVKIEEVPLTVPKVNHTVVSKKVQHVVPNAAMKKSSTANKKSPRKVIPTREREFDADKHCGVWVQDQQKRCTRSLTCKTHALSLRRAVPGRRKKFDELLAEHKARVNCEKEQQQQNLAALKLLESKTSDKNNVLKGNGLITEPTTKSSNDKHSTLRLSSNEVSEDNFEVPQKTMDGESDGIEDSVSYNDLTTLNYHPKPLATCTFGGKKVGNGAFIFNRRQDHFRCAMLAVVERCLNPSQQRHTSGRPGAAAILHRPSIKTIAQSSNHGLFKGSSTLGDKKSHSGSGRNLSNFLKAPPPPRNRSLKHNNVIHGNHSVKHSVDTSTGYTMSRTSNNKHFMDSSSSTATPNEGNGFLKPDASSQAISDMGNIIASIDANVSNGQSIAIGQSPGNNLRTPGNFPAGANVSLDSSLNLCSNLGINSDVSTTGTRTAYSTIYTTINNTNAVNTAQAGNVKDILPVPLTGKVNGVSGGTSSSSSNAVVQIAGQLDPNSGKVSVTSTATQRESPIFFTTQNSGAVQVASSLPNGTGPSPPPIVTSVKGYPLSFVIQGSSGTKGGTAVAAVAGQSPVGFTKAHSLVFNNIGMAQMQQQSAHIIAQQPTSPLQQQQVQQKGKVLLRANSYPKANSKTSNSQGKIPQSPSPQQQQQQPQLSPSQAPSQQKTIIVTSPPPGQQNLYLNHQHIPNTSQPIVQLKQQVEQQQQQLQQITLQQQLQQQQIQQQQLQQQQHKQINSQFVKQQLPIQPRLAPAPHPPSQSLISQQQISGQNIVIKASDQPLKSPPNSVFVTTDSHQNIQTAVTHKPQSNVA